MFKENNLFDKIIFFTYQGLIIIMPWFFLPWTSSRFGMDNFNKQFLLWLIIPILFFWQCWRRHQERLPIIKKTSFFWPIIFLAVAAFLSAAASVDKFSSFWGGQSSIIMPFFSLLSFILFFQFSVIFLDSKEKIEATIKSLIISCWVIIAAAILIFSGILSQSTIFTNYFKLAAGSLEELTIYISVICVLQLAILLGCNFKFGVNLKKQQKIVITLGLLVSLIILLAANFLAAWLVIFCSVVFLLLSFLAVKIQKGEDIFDQEFFKKIFWPLLFVVVSGVLLLVNVFYIDGAALNRRFAQNLRLDYASTRQLAATSFLHKQIVGSGLETFGYDYSLWHKQNFNNSVYWNLRFDKSPSYFLEIIIVSGLLGLLGWLFFVGVFCFLIYKIFFSYKKELKKKDETDLLFLFLSTALCLGLIIGQIFFTVNTVLLFLFWLSLALFASNYIKIFAPEKKGFCFTSLFTKNKKFQNNIFLIVIFFCFFGWLTFWSFSVKYWVANFYYQRGVKLSTVNEDEAIVNLERAIKLNSQRYEYGIVLSKLYLNKGQNALVSQSANLNEVQSSFDQSINWGQQAIRVGEKSIAAYENLSKIYRDVGAYLAMANNLAIETLNVAISLEPMNPVLFTEMGKIYFSTGQADKAVEAYEKALVLKSDYSDAEFNLAKVKGEQGKYDEALALLDGLEDKYDAASVFYEEGRIFYNQKRYDAAIEKFKQVISLSPNYANALYGLASTFQAVGDEQQALYYFKKVEQLNPSNQELLKKIEDLKK